MSRAAAILHNRRQRNLLVLVILAVLSIWFAIMALAHQAALMAPKYVPHTFFPGLAQKDRHIASIRITSKKYGTVAVDFIPERGWVLPAEHDFPANFALVRKTIFGMVGLEAVAPKTARPQWLKYLDLEAPPQGRGVKVALYDDKGHTIAAMIAGKTTTLGELGQLGLFVRTPSSSQSWLARSVFQPDPNPADWMNKDVLHLHRAEIKSVTVRPTDGPSYTVERATPSVADFAVKGLPKGSALSYPTAPDGPAYGLVDFSFDKAVPIQTIDFAHAAEMETTTFDGLSITARIAAQDGNSWVALSAAAKPGNRAAGQQARTINKTAGGWAFEIPAYKAAQLTTPLDNLLKPKPRPVTHGR
ncbi:MAG: DUF4340 domain-containing protein [Alphaproteobacteria bacterium]|nr:DUF4340 domain-containing protein [Alphaproteobacteria bacterium]